MAACFPGLLQTQTSGASLPAPLQLPIFVPVNSWDTSVSQPSGAVPFSARARARVRNMDTSRRQETFGKLVAAASSDKGNGEPLSSEPEPFSQDQGKQNPQDSGSNPGPNANADTGHSLSPSNGAGSGASDAPLPQGSEWQDVFPQYLQNRENEQRRVNSETGSRGWDVSRIPGEVFFDNWPRGELNLAARTSTNVNHSYFRDSSVRNDPIWAAIRAEAKLEAEQEPILSSFLYASILAHDCFERSLGFVLANRLKNVTLLATQLMDVFDDVLMRNDIRAAIRADVQAVRERDPSCTSYNSALLYFKGYHALQSYRIAHALWNRGQRILALALQSRISEVFAVDIHPAARIGQGILMDHGTGVVIGETAVVGDNVSMLQGVTLGGTGKEAGDRHPKVQECVLIGAGATILGNITIGRGSMIAAGSLVLKDVPPHSMMAGTPAKVVGTVKEDAPSLTMKHDVTRYYTDQLKNGNGDPGL